jgi:hypothetical protein
MKSALEKLTEMAGAQLLDKEVGPIEDLFDNDEPLSGQLAFLLRMKNGFYLFESALHIFPSESTKTEIGLKDWNKNDLWIDSYKGMATKAVFFAEDIFGGQFCIKDGSIYTFDPETAAFEQFAKNLGEWAENIIADYSYITGYPLAHEWQKKYGTLATGKRLLPIIPFVTQGSYSVENLKAIDSVKGMRWRAEIAAQIANLKDGDSIEITVID